MLQFVVLDHPEVPLNTNGAERDLRVIVTRRKLSGGTRSQYSKLARDTFLGLYKICHKLGLFFWDEELLPKVGDGLIRRRF